MNVCLVCEGELALLGQLGKLLWCRCTRCGLDQHLAAEGFEVDDEGAWAPEEDE